MKKRKLTTRLVSLAVAFGTLMSFAAFPVATAASATMSLSDDTLSLAKDYCTYTATLSVPASQVEGNADAWAKKLTWTLLRDEPFVDPEVVAYWYPGDELKNWQTWGTDGTDGRNWFEIDEPVVEEKDGMVIVTLSFTTNPFMMLDETTSRMMAAGKEYRMNFYNSFTGTYELSASYNGKKLAGAEMRLNPYDGYQVQSEIYDELEEIKKLAEKKGRYMEIRNFGTSEEGQPLVYACLSDSKASVDKFKKMNEIAVTDPASLMSKIKDGKLDGEDYRIPFFITNIHPDENPAVTVNVEVLRVLATEDTISYNTITGLVDGEVDMSLFDPKFAEMEGFTGFGARKISGAEKVDNDCKTDASEYYTFSDKIEINVDELLDNIILLSCPTENPDGNLFNTRKNAEGHDMNRHGAKQVPVEKACTAELIDEWNPAVYIEHHGFFKEFEIGLVGCPPYNQSIEFDLYAKNAMLASEAYGNAALATLSVEGDHAAKIQMYEIPVRDVFNPKNGWGGDVYMGPNLGTTYGLINCGAIAGTIEVPLFGEVGVDILKYGTFGMLDYVRKAKDDIYLNQLEFFRRGIENEDHRDKLEKWYVDYTNAVMPEDTWRVPNKENDNFFPEYYIIPTHSEIQRDIADAYFMGEYFTRNGVDVKKLTKDVTVNGVTYKAGDLVVDMHQAKRNMAQVVLHKGIDITHTGGFARTYSEFLTNYPEQLGFDCYPIAIPGALDGALSGVITDFSGNAELTGTGSNIVIANNGEEAVRAINALLDANKPVAFITDGEHKGDFLVSRSTFNGIKDKFIVEAHAVSNLPPANPIYKPMVLLAGRYGEYHSDQSVQEGYYSKWFKNGYGYKNYMDVNMNDFYAEDRSMYEKQLGFTLTEDADKADLIIGCVDISRGNNGDANIAAVWGGTPYIASGNYHYDASYKYLQKDFIPELEFRKAERGDSLFKVNYLTDSLITARQKRTGDDLLYSTMNTVFTNIPEEAEVIIKTVEKDAMVAGCIAARDLDMDNFIQGFTLEREGIDLTVFANSTSHRSFQQDDILLVTNAVYAKSMGEQPITQAQLDGTEKIPAKENGAEKLSFADVSKKSWAGNGIKFMVDNGVMIGTAKDKFSPNAGTSRAMVATVLYRMENEPEVNKTPSFADVADGQWYSDAIAWCEENEIMLGYGGSRFGVNDEITREQLFLTLSRYAGKEQANASSAISWAVENDLISESKNPKTIVSRAECADVLMRFIKSFK